jgi:hypothetical protein
MIGTDAWSPAQAEAELVSVITNTDHSQRRDDGGL